jgi:hypothetical protein
LTDHQFGFIDGRDRAGQASPIVILNDGARQGIDLVSVHARIYPTFANERTNLLGQGGRL